MLIVLAHERWRFGFNDPTLMGWVVTASYLGAALACFRAAGLRDDRGDRTSKIVWCGLGVVLIGLSINKELDFQTLGLDQVRDFADVQGWFSHRRMLLGGFLLGCLAAFVLAMRILLRKIPAPPKSLHRALVGFAGLVIAVLLPFLPSRSLAVLMETSMVPTRNELWHIEVGELFELGFIALIGVSAANSLAPGTRPPRTQSNRSS